MKPYGKLKQYALPIFCESLTTEVEMVPGMGEYTANQIYKIKNITSRNTDAKLLSLVFGQLANLSIHSTTGSIVISVHRKKAYTPLLPVLLYLYTENIPPLAVLLYLYTENIHSTTGSIVISVPRKKYTLHYWQSCYICTQKTFHHWQYCYICTQKTHSTTGNIAISVDRKHIIHSTTGSIDISVHRKHTPPLAILLYL